MIECQIAIAEVDTCVSSPCLNGGKCVNTKESYRCDCPLGYKGGNCEIEINECLALPCYLDSTCVNKVPLNYWLLDSVASMLMLVE